MTPLSQNTPAPDGDPNVSRRLTIYLSEDDRAAYNARCSSLGGIAALVRTALDKACASRMVIPDTPSSGAATALKIRVNERQYQFVKIWAGLGRTATQVTNAAVRALPETHPKTDKRNRKRLHRITDDRARIELKLLLVLQALREVQSVLHASLPSIDTVGLTGILLRIEERVTSWGRGRR